MRMIEISDGFCFKISDDDVEDAAIEEILEQKTLKDLLLS
jgi:hypothetical protein